MKKNKFLWYCVILIVMGITYFIPEISHDYIDFHSAKKNIERLKNKDFEVDLASVDEIKEIEINSTPDLKFLDELVKKIDGAKEKVYLQTYIFTEKRIRSALIKAKKRGVEVKVILEKEIYNAPNLNYKAYKDLEKNRVDVKWASNEYSLVHTKLLVVDDTAIIGTGNYSYSTFKTNRDFFLTVEDEEIVSVVTHNFLSEFREKYDYKFDENIVKSPFNTRDIFDELLTSTQQNVKFYIQNFSDDNVFNQILALLERGVNVEIVAPTYKKIPGNQKYFDKLINKGAKVYFLKSPYIHAKSILVDDNILYIGSINFSYYSIEKNGEIGLIIKNRDIIEKFKKTFLEDIKN